MSSRKRQVVPFVVALFALTLGGLVHAQSPGDVVQVPLERDGAPITNLSRDACKDFQLKIVFPQTITAKHTEFRATVRPLETDDKIGGPPKDPKSACQSKLTSHADRPLEFSKNDPVSSRIFLPKTACEKDTGLSGTRVLCIYGEPGRDDLLAYASLTFNTEVAKLESVNVIAINGTVKLKATVSNASTTVNLETCYVEKTRPDLDADDEDGCPKDKNFILHPSSLETTISGLKNNVTYSFKVRIAGQEIDDKPGKQVWPIRFEATPVPAAFPLTVYQGAGGEFSCQTTTTSSLMVLLATLALLWFMRSRAKPSASTALLILSFMVLPVDHGHAQPNDPGFMNFGILGAMYRPALDNEPGANSFYQSFFKRNPSDTDGAINPLMGIEVDWHVYDGFGSLQLGVGIGYTFVNGNVLLLDSRGKPDPNKELEGGSASLHMYQIRPQITYLLNHFAEYVPIFPYVRGALIAHGYSFFENDKNESSGTVKPNGFRFGYQFALGLMLMLDFLEPGAIREGRSAELLSHVYLKGELSYTKIDTFGTPGFDFSAKDVMGSSLPLMWTFGLVFEIPE